MLVSKKNLQSYFDKELPSAHALADVLMTHSFEIEGVTEINSDWVIDVDVLPNRAHDCLSHSGIALELSTLLDLPIKKTRYSLDEISYTDNKKLNINIENESQCLRYSAVLVENISVQKSPEWLQNRLVTLGQKSINNLVDATNYIMFDLGQPLHVFDADKVVGKITIRNACVDEKIKTLSGDLLELIETDLVIADDEGILALAGVKGGTKAEVTEETKNIIIESANFNPVTTRKTARRVKIFTDASKRYENGLSSELTIPALESMLALVIELSGNEKTIINSILDNYPNREQPFVLKFSREHTAKILGFDITSEEISKILFKKKYDFSVNNDIFEVSIPYLRLDLRIAEDMIEEIGRIYGYQNIPIKSVDEYNFETSFNQKNYAIQVLTNYFIKSGFYEIKNYSFEKKGDIELANPLSKEKAALRKNLFKQMEESIKKNVKNADFLGLDQISLFEIDNVVTKQGEILICCFGIDALSKKNRKIYGDEQTQINRHKKEILSLMKNDNIEFSQNGFVVSFEIISEIQSDNQNYLSLFNEKTYPENAQFTHISKFPYIKRDISFWIKDKKESEIKEIILNSNINYLENIYLFDRFEKNGNTSFAFSLIFQSQEKTLTDREVELEMEKVNNLVIQLGGEIR